VTGHRQQLPGRKTWLHKDSKKTFRPKREEKQLLEFLRDYAKSSPEQRKQYEFLTGRKAPKPLTKKEREAWAKKALAQIKGRGLGTSEMFMFADLFDEWWYGQWKIAKKEKRLVRGKGEKHRRTRKGWRKALPVIKKNREEKKRTETDRYIESFGSSSYSQARRKL
jgi:hypothetical protein